GSAAASSCSASPRFCWAPPTAASCAASGGEAREGGREEGGRRIITETQRYRVTQRWNDCVRPSVRGSPPATHPILVIAGLDPAIQGCTRTGWPTRGKPRAGLI